MNRHSINAKCPKNQDNYATDLPDAIAYVVVVLPTQRSARG